MFSAMMRALLVLEVLHTTMAVRESSPRETRPQTGFFQSRDLPPDSYGDPNARGERNVMQDVPVVGGAFEVKPVSTTLKCVVSLTLQYLIVYTALALCRTAADRFNMKYDNIPVQKILVTASLTVNYAPMLAVLFLACRMRVLQLTKMQGNPPEWMQLCMYFCTYSVLAMTLSVCAIPLFTGEVVGVDPKTGDIPSHVQPFKNIVCAFLFTGFKYMIMFGLYGGTLAVIYGIATYEPPVGTWPAGKAFPVSPAVLCCMILTCQYFLVYAGVMFARTWSQWNGEKKTKFEDAMMTATNAMNFAPMLAILFIAARMRALQMDPVNGNPQRWAQNCFFMCTYAVLLQTVLAIAVPLVMKGEAKPGKAEGDMEYTVENKMLGTVLTIGRFLMMLCIYIGFSCVIWSIFTIEHPKGPEYTPPISVTMQCVVNLTVQFFAIYLLIWASITLKEFTGSEWTLLTQTMESAKATVALAPMLCILFVGTRMRALQLTNNRGAPQGWVQDGMYMCTWAVMVQFVMCLITPVFTGTPAVLDEDGNSKWEPANRVGFLVVQAIRWIGFFLLYGGVITVMIGIFSMTPANANGRGAVPLVGDGKVPGTDTGVPGYDGIGEPVGANDLPGVPGF